MNSSAPVPVAARRAADGSLRVDWRVLLSIAAPLMVTNAIQAILNLTDTWFIGRLSTESVAAMGSIFWLMQCVILVLGGVGLAAQSFVSQAEGARRRARAAQSAWSAVWGSVGALPLFVLAAFAGGPLLSIFRLDPGLEALALAYWEPRLLGAMLAVMGWALASFFNGIGRTGITLAMAAVTTLSNIPANEFFMFTLGWGMAGAAWGTNLAQALGVMLGFAVLLSRPFALRYRTRLMWRPSLALIRRQLAVGLPVGVMYGADILGVALMQLMVTAVGTAGAAATQIVMMLTSISYLPAIGLASAGTTVVGQAIGAGDRDWAARIGTFVTRRCSIFMFGVALSLLLAGPWLLPWFITADDPTAGETIALALLFLWPAAAYQLFDGLYFGSSFCLRATGDTQVPARTALLLSWCGFVPLAHMLIFTAEEAWLPGLPQAGLGALGGWLALMSYAMCLGVIMYRRWRSERWRSIELWRTAARLDDPRESA